MRVRLDTVHGERRGRRTTKQVWVATVGVEYEGRGRTRREAIANCVLRPYDMDFDSLDWKIRFAGLEVPLPTRAMGLA